MDDKHELIYKAAGWMLREVGKRNLKIEEEFLRSRYKKCQELYFAMQLKNFPTQKNIFKELFKDLLWKNV